MIDDLDDALYAARICAYAQGMALIRAGADHVQLERSTSREIGRIWKGGCIIRARLLDPVRKPSRRSPGLVNLLLDPAIGDDVESAQAGWRRTVVARAASGIPRARARVGAGVLRQLSHRAAAAEPDPGAARRLRRAHLRAHRPPRRRAQRVVIGGS